MNTADDPQAATHYRSQPYDEYVERVERLQARLRDAEIGAALLSSPANVAYYSGFRTTIEAPSLVWAMLVVPADANPHAVVSMAMTNLFRESTWIADVHPFGGAPYWGLPTDPVAMVRDVVFQYCGNPDGRVAMEIGQGMRVALTIDEIERLQRALAELLVVDLAPLVWDQRSVKTVWEQDIYRRLGRITAAGFSTGAALAREGIKEREIQRAMWSAFIAAGADDSPVGGQLMIRSGRERNLTYCGRATNRTLTSGEQLMLAGGPTLEGYHIDIHRFFCIGDEPPLQRALFRQSEAGLEAAIKVTRPGVTTKEIFDAASSAMARFAATDVVPWQVFGHGIGLENYEPPMINAATPVEVVEGMVLALEVPSYDIPGGRVMGAFQEECVLVTSTGCELLTAGVSRELMTLR